MLQGTMFPNQSIELILIVYKQKCSTIGVKQTNIVPVLGNVNCTLYNVHNIFFSHIHFSVLNIYL